MSWFGENSFNWLKRLAIKVTRAGRVPNHVAFIMDGNRRYAAKYKMEKIEGHTKGFNGLTDTLEWCRELGIREVTVYAFSIENFKRSPEEVGALMELARQKCQQLIDEREKFQELGVRVRVFGKLSLLPEEIRKLVVEAMKVTENNTPSILNIAFPYTKITQAVSAIVTGVSSGAVSAEDVSENLLTNCLYTNPNRPPDLLIRTSGEVRLSDFLLWQTSLCCLYFTAKLWPEFELWDMLRAVLHYQRSYDHLAAYKAKNCPTVDLSSTSEFIASVQKSRKLELYAERSL